MRMPFAQTEKLESQSHIIVQIYSILHINITEDQSGQTNQRADFYPMGVQWRTDRPPEFYGFTKRSAGWPSSVR